MKNRCRQDQGGYSLDEKRQTWLVRGVEIFHGKQALLDCWVVEADRGFKGTPKGFGPSVLEELGPCSEKVKTAGRAV